MEKKIPSAIEQITLNTATFHGSAIKPTLINFFFGKNGVGKSTIARCIASNCGLAWRENKTASDYSILVYDQDFITTNIQSYENLPGVFTISEQNIEIQKQIDEKQLIKNNLNEQLKKLSITKQDKSDRLAYLLSNFQETCWNKTRTLRAFFVETQSGKKQKATFATGALSVISPTEHEITSLKILYETAFDPNSRTYKEFQPVDNSVLAQSNLLTKPIVSSNDTPFASFIKALNATDWVRHGHEQFHSTPNSKCPYCQQILPADFENQISSCFDAQYQQDIEELKNYKLSYKTKANEIWSVLKANIQDPYPKLDLTEYKDKFALFESTIKLNLQKIEDKIQAPASSIDLDDICTILDDLNTLSASFNLQIQENNTIVTTKRQKQVECKRKVWEYIAYTLQTEIKEYTINKNVLETEVGSLTTQINNCNNTIQLLRNEIRALNKQVVNTKAAIDSINTLLHDSGFQGFSLREKNNTPNVYEVIRSDGTIAKNLSEGERNFIAFLYFYQLVRGSDSDDGSTKDKIVVIDDPVSSMDSGTLFIVSTLVRELIEICHNNADYENNLIPNDYIKQIFILTHNAFFHREITYNQVSQYTYVSFFIINKLDNISNIKLCERPNPNAPTQIENYNPVQNAYAALWTEYKEVKTAIPTLNVIRRILDYYFLQLCGYNGANIRNRILRDNRQKFITVLENGVEDCTKYNLASAMLSYLDTNTNSISDGLNYIDDCLDVSQYRVIFKMIFELMGQIQHYTMMMSATK